MYWTKILGGIVLAAIWAAQPSAAQAVSLHVADADVRDVLSSTALLGGINLIIDDSVTGMITIDLDDLEPQEALHLIASAKGLFFDDSGGAIVISSRQRAAPGFCRTYVFPIQYADLDELVEDISLSAAKEGIFLQTENKYTDGIGTGTLQERNAPYGDIKKSEWPHSGSENRSSSLHDDKDNRLKADHATGSLVFFGTETEADDIRAALTQLDVPAKQVTLEAKVVALQKDASKKLGIEWEWSKIPQYAYEGDEVHRVWTNGESVPGIISFGGGPDGNPYEFYYAVTLNALIANGQATILAKPNITTIQGHAAVINIGGEVPVPTVETTNSTTTTSFEYKEAGIILRYMPMVNADGCITARVHTEVSSPQYVEDLKAYRFQKRSADTVVRLQDGETMVIGGLIGSEESRTLSEIPFLANLPILGSFFRSVKNTRNESEIMIFLTAHVLDER